MSGLRPQPSTWATVTTRASAVAKVTRPAASWREMYEVATVGVAIHNAVRENA